jgi:uncharacterized membrane protein
VLTFSLAPTLSPALASLVLGPLQFDAPAWLWLLPVLAGLALWIGRRSLAGLDGWTRWLALCVRLLVIAFLVGVLADPHWREESEDVSVTFVLDASRSVPVRTQAEIDRAVERLAGEKREAGDRAGIVTAARGAFVQGLPASGPTLVERRYVGEDDGSDLAAGARLALGVQARDAANRIVLVSDGNETAGSLLQVADSARAMGVPIDVVPIRYAHESEVVVEKLVAPAMARMGQTIDVRVILSATKETRGRLSLLMDGRPIDLDPDSQALSTIVDLKPGLNPLSVPVPDLPARPVEFRAVFEPLVSETGVVGDAIVENNEAIGVTFVSGEGRVLVVRDDPRESQAFVHALTQARIACEEVSAEEVPADLRTLSGYDAIVMMNQQSYLYSDAQQRALRQFVHDAGGGLIMTGGPDAFGAGGWIGSTLEDALPIRLDPPQKRQMPKGALVIVLDVSGSMESPVQGTNQSQLDLAVEASVLAAKTLSRLDEFGFVVFSGDFETVVPLTRNNDPAATARRIRSVGPQGGTNMFPAIDEAARMLRRTDAAQRHIIVLSDGQTMGDAQTGVTLAQKIAGDGITISTVAVGDGADAGLMGSLAQSGRGRSYIVAGGASIATLPKIFVKEAQTVRRSLIWEGEAFAPKLIAGASEPMRGVLGVPPVSGYVVAADREGLSIVSLRGKEDDPILAQWQYGLGKVVTYTSDVASRWGGAWVGWDGFRSFWEQHVRWAMRPGGDANVRVITENDGDSTRVIVEAFDQAGERVNFARFSGRIARPDGSGEDVTLAQAGPGRYLGSFRSDQAGSYILSLNYARMDEQGQLREGGVRAAVSRPYADEFRALSDNAAMLQQVAEITGGEVLSLDDPSANPWRRTGLTPPVALQSIWLLLTLIAIGLFIMDVGVRRVRIDVRAMARTLSRSLRAGEARGAEQMGALSRAKAQARARMAASAEASSNGVARESRRPEKVASRKFEASPEQLERTGDAPIVTSAPPPAPRANDDAKAGGTPKAPAAGEGLSRLMAAKKRAQEGIDE